MSTIDYIYVVDKKISILHKSDDNLGYISSSSLENKFENEVYTCANKSIYGSNNDVSQYSSSEKKLSASNSMKLLLLSKSKPTFSYDAFYSCISLF